MEKLPPFPIIRIYFYQPFSKSPTSNETRHSPIALLQMRKRICYNYLSVFFLPASNAWNVFKWKRGNFSRCRKNWELRWAPPYLCFLGHTLSAHSLFMSGGGNSYLVNEMVQGCWWLIQVPAAHREKYLSYVDSFWAIWNAIDGFLNHQKASS